MSRHDAIAAIERERLLAILRPGPGDDPVARLAELADAGVRCAEISLATAAGRDGLARAADALGDRLVLGAGTVRTIADAELAMAARARFLVAPCLNLELLAWCAEAAIACLPGVLTPTEVDSALQAGAPLIKLFPAGRLGPDYVRDLLAPFPEARIVATGAVGAENAASFLEAGACAVAVGGALSTRDDTVRLLRAVHSAVPAAPASDPVKDTP